MTWPVLRWPPVLYVHTAQHEVTRVDCLTIEQARAVIVRLCDELESACREADALRKGRRDA